MPSEEAGWADEGELFALVQSATANASGAHRLAPGSVPRLSVLFLLLRFFLFCVFFPFFFFASPHEARRGESPGRCELDSHGDALRVKETTSCPLSRRRAWSKVKEIIAAREYPARSDCCTPDYRSDADKRVKSFRAQTPLRDVETIGIAIF